MEQIEDMILRYSQRGMERLRSELSPYFCRDAAETLLSQPRGNVLLTTGFCVYDHAETDGPAGTFCVANALKAEGFTPIIVTDEYCRGIFESVGIDTVYYDIRGGIREAKQILERYSPTALFSLERCGMNMSCDYMNMRGDSIRGKTAPIDMIFIAAKGQIPTIGVGDGGNEIGMGNLAGCIVHRLSINPCVVTVDQLVIATVSNWGGYGICAYMEQLTGHPLTPSYEEVNAFMKGAAAFGCIDGVSGLPTLTEDGFPEKVTQEILTALKKAVQ